MYGVGAVRFAVMSYVIANMMPDKRAGFFQVDLNPNLLSGCIGEPVEEIIEAISFLCKPDPATNTPGENGRRLIKIGAFAYQVVNGQHYYDIKNEEDRRESARVRQAKHRAKIKTEDWRAPLGKTKAELETEKEEEPS